MKKTILIKPLITEKSEMISEKENKACFVVHRRANKIEIKNAVESTYNVSVVSVNTAVMPGKTKSRNTKSGVLKGQSSSFKKAIVKLAEGEDLNLYGEM